MTLWCDDIPGSVARAVLCSRAGFCAVGAVPVCCAFLCWCCLPVMLARAREFVFLSVCVCIRVVMARPFAGLPPSRDASGEVLGARGRESGPRGKGVGVGECERSRIVADPRRGSSLRGSMLTRLRGLCRL